VLLISGYHDDQTEPEAPSLQLIRKPFSATALIERIREVLDNSIDCHPDPELAEGEGYAVSQQQPDTTAASPAKNHNAHKSSYSTPKGDAPC
jgi:hypothetical protein